MGGQRRSRACVVSAAPGLGSLQVRDVVVRWSRRKTPVASAVPPGRPGPEDVGSVIVGLRGAQPNLHLHLLIPNGVRVFTVRKSRFTLYTHSCEGHTHQMGGV